ncbi:hypothetical protein [Mycolicibacterium mucogenicum]|uniref:Holin n=1 Tax=Mycolicibacterium mucogenicum DSM 44124 TaxID=1226753 RepID=A0A8H2PE99_MYCMU|nr:hypothetical protein [Mycolicibacterium mucogenicum]QPG69970.1 hypothetical protein C1S78_002770 [Mycolicibacterium mucogenicum DSM 44124]
MKLASEDKIDTRKALYGVTALAGAAATIAQAFHLIDADTAANFGNLLQALGQFLPTAGVTAAAVVLGRQAKVPGMLEPTPPPLSPLEQVTNGVAAANQIVADTVAAANAAHDELSKIQQAAAGLGPLAQQVIASIR